MKNEKTLIVISLISIILLFALGAYYYKNLSNFTQSTSKETLLIKPYSFKIGSDDAKVKLVEFFDPACGTCAQFYPFVKEIMKKHPEQIQLILRYAPFHENSDEVVKIIEASREQNLYLETLEFFFATQRYWINNHVVDKQAVWKLLENFWIDVSKLKADVQSEKITQLIKEDLEDAKALHVNKTPSYFVNGRALEKFGYQELVDLIEEELKK